MSQVSDPKGVAGAVCKINWERSLLLANVAAAVVVAVSDAHGVDLCCEGRTRHRSAERMTSCVGEGLKA